MCQFRAKNLPSAKQRRSSEGLSQTEGGDSNNLTRLARAAQKVTVLCSLEKWLTHDSTGSENTSADLVIRETAMHLLLSMCTCVSTCVHLCKYRNMCMCAARMTEVNFSVSVGLHPPSS